jgi:hypothetical protein
VRWTTTAARSRSFAESIWLGRRYVAVSHCSGPLYGVPHELLEPPGIHPAVGLHRAGSMPQAVRMDRKVNMRIASGSRDHLIDGESAELLAAFACEDVAAPGLLLALEPFQALGFVTLQVMKDVSNDRQDIGRKSRCLRLAGHAHALDGAVGRAQAAFPAPWRRQGRLGAFRDRLTLVFGNGRQDVDGQLVGRGDYPPPRTLRPLVHCRLQ